ncbi:MAG TPA: DNRLRE domain-containing protein [Anaerolineae bacterium]|nr:DNRLRE domain-containing protein [Anaerolineae bacterium]
MAHRVHPRQTNIAWARAVRASAIAGVILIALLAFGATTLPTQAAPGATAVARLSPAVITVTTAAASAKVDIVIEDVSNLYGVDVRLTFDPKRLAVQDANPGQAGVQIELGSLLTSGTEYVLFNVVDNVAGTIKLVITQLNPTPAVTGNGVLARVTFKLKGRSGVSPLHFTRTDLASRDALLIPVTARDGAIVIQPPLTCKTIQRGALGQVADSYIWSLMPRGNFNTARLYTARFHPFDETRSLIRFGLDILPKGAVVQSATLGLELGGQGSGQPVNIYRITHAWSERQPTWSNFAAQHDGAVAWGSFATGKKASVTADVTGLVSVWLKGNLPNYGLMLKSTSNHAAYEYFSSEIGKVGSRPWLKVCYFVP